MNSPYWEQRRKKEQEEKIEQLNTMEAKKMDKNAGVKCPHCKSNILELYCNVTATCSGYLNILDDCADYDIDGLTDNIEMDDFCCSECDMMIAKTEEEAKNFLNGK